MYWSWWRGGSNSPTLDTLRMSTYSQISTVIQHCLKRRPASLLAFSRSQICELSDFCSMNLKSQLTHNGLDVISKWAVLGNDIFHCRVKSLAGTADKLAFIWRVTALFTAHFSVITATTFHADYLYGPSSSSIKFTCSFAGWSSSFHRGVKTSPLLAYST